MSEIYEDLVFSRMDKGKSKSRVAFTSDGKYLSEVYKNILNFDMLLEKDNSIKVSSIEEGVFKVRGLKRKAFDLFNLLQNGNPGINFQFSEDLLNFEPDQELIKKSKVPLWVVHPLDSQSVMIKRVY
jgi:hypothetical protein